MTIDKNLKNVPKDLVGKLNDAKPALEKLGNTIGNTISTLGNKVTDFATNFLDIGKSKRMKGVVKTIANGVVSFEKNAMPIFTNPDGNVGA